MRTHENAAVKIAIKRRVKAETIEAGYKSLYEWQMRHQNADMVCILKCFKNGLGGIKIMQVKTIFTPKIAAEMNASDTFNQFILDSIYRHLSGDWGDVSKSDAKENTADSLNALSIYTAPNGVKIWVKQDYNILTVAFSDEC